MCRCIAALKDNRLVALSEQDKKEGRFVRDRDVAIDR